MSQTADATEPVLLTPHVDLRRVEIVVNPRSGSVGPKAAGECEKLLADLGLEANIVECDPLHLTDTIASAIESRPDALVILAGDGTARAAAEMAGPHGPLIAPLPGGTMNLLPHALYGTTDWKEALTLALTEGRVRNVAGGEVDGHPFYVAAILGNPALWAPARESIREAKWILAWLYAKRAARRAFSHRLRFEVDGEVRKGEAMVLLSPLISKAMDKPTGLEAAFVDVRSTGDVLRLGLTTLFRDWRADPGVETFETRHVRVRARQPIPVLLDGEAVTLDEDIEVRFRPVAFRALAPAARKLDDPIRA